MLCHPFKPNFSIDLETGNVLYKTVYIDKPLPTKQITPRERNQKFYDVALKNLVLRHPDDIVETGKPLEDLNRGNVFLPPLDTVTNTPRLIGSL
jgi:hypothetical protein